MKLWLTQATTSAPEVDYLILALLLISCAVLALVFGLMLLYMIKYRAGSGIDRGALAEKTWRLETAWTIATLVAFFGLFIWGADLYLRLFQPPPDAMKIYVIGKQWMWKVEHPGGQSEINALRDAVVPGHNARNLSFVLHATLRHRTRPDDRRDRGNDRARVSEMAGAARRQRDTGCGGKDLIHA
jgi:heme/copper-type cytochrome/quinol oxidase subunit 2